MKVLLISVRDDGGGAKHLLQILTHHQSDIQFYVAAPLKNPLGTEIQKRATQFVEIPFRRFSLLSYFRLVSLCKRHQVTTVHSHGRGAGWYSRAMKIFGLRVIHTLHGTHIEAGLINQVKVAVDRLLVSVTDTFICVSNGEKKEALEHRLIHGKRAVVIFNGVEFKGRVENLSQDKGNLKVAMLGRLCYQKGYDLMISSVESFCQNHPDIDFEINVGGDGEDFDHLLRQLSETEFAKSRIKFLGHISDVENFLNNHDLLLSFSRFEGMPYAILEAMSLGVPCMVTNVVGNHDVISNENGYLFDYFEFDKVFLKIFLRDFEALKASAYLDIKNKFNLNLNVQYLIDLYLEGE